MTDDLLAFLRRMLDEDQRIAEATMQASPHWRNFDMDGELRDSANAGTVCWVPHPQDRDHIARHDPARVLREVALKKAIIKAHGIYPDPMQIVEDYDGDRYLGTRLGSLFHCRTCGAPPDTRRNTWPCKTIRHLAAVYSDRDGYKPEWAPGD